MQSAFQQLKLIFKQYMKHIEEQNSKQTEARKVQQYCEMVFREPIDYYKVRRLRGNSDESALTIDTQKYYKQEWSTIFPIVSQLRFEKLQLSNIDGILNIMIQIKNIHFIGLKQLTLSYCSIQSIESLSFMNLNVLKQLDLCINPLTKAHNAINSLKSLRKINSPGLEQLNVSDNCLVSLQFIEQIKFSKHVKQIILQYNNYEVCIGQSINYLWKIQAKYLRTIRLMPFILGFETYARINGLFFSSHKKQRFRPLGW